MPEPPRREPQLAGSPRSGAATGRCPDRPPVQCSETTPDACGLLPSESRDGRDGLGAMSVRELWNRPIRTAAASTTGPALSGSAPVRGRGSTPPAPFGTGPHEGRDRWRTARCWFCRTARARRADRAAQPGRTVGLAGRTEGELGPRPVPPSEPGPLRRCRLWPGSLLVRCPATKGKSLKGRQQAAAGGRARIQDPLSAAPGVARSTHQARLPFPEAGPDLLLLSRGGGI